MTEFSLDVDEIKKDVETTLKEEEEKLENSNLKDQAQGNATAIFEANLDNPQERENILKPLDNFGLNQMSKSAAHNCVLRILTFDSNQNYLMVSIYFPFPEDYPN